MKRSQIWLLALLVPFTIGVLFTSCDKDDDDDCPVVDYTTLDQSISSAQTTHDAAVEGTNPGEYLVGSKTALASAITLATTVRNTECVTQAQLDAAKVALDAAVVTFGQQLITDVAPGALVAHWLFNGDGMDASGNGHDGVASAGHPAFGAGMPELAADRFGNANYCYKFVDGGNFVVPQDNAFIPNEMTISLWVNLYETWAHSYIISNDIWNTWKFQIQDANKPFLTAHFLKDDGTGEEGWIDKDSNGGVLENDTWTHVVVSYTGGKMVFYLDGVKVQEWEDFPSGNLIAPNPDVDLCIGQALPTDVYTDIEGDPYQWQEWLGHFKGYMDDFRFYNVLLTDAQVQTLYNYEKDNAITE